jgi:hypothetical protein
MDLIDREKVLNILWARSEVADACGHDVRREAFLELYEIFKKAPKSETIPECEGDNCVIGR